jgi:hypothetical protein
VCGEFVTVAVLHTAALFITGCCTLWPRVRKCVYKPDTRPISQFEWSFTSAPPVHVHGVNTDGFKSAVTSTTMIQRL